MEMKMEKLRTRLRRDMTNSILYYIHSSLRIFYFWISIHSLLQRGGAGISSLYNMWYESILHILYQLSFLTDLYLSAPPGFVLYITDSLAPILIVFFVTLLLAGQLKSIKLGKEWIKCKFDDAISNEIFYTQNHKKKLDCGYVTNYVLHIMMYVNIHELSHLLPCRRQ